MTEENRSGRLIIVCPNKNCGQRLAIPKTVGTLHITCPKCGTTFEHTVQTTIKKQPTVKRPTEKQPTEKQVTEKQPTKKGSTWLITKIKKHPIFLGLVIILWFLLLVNRYSNGTLTIGNGILTSVIFGVLWLFCTWFLDKLREKAVKWYYKKWFVLLMLIVLPPIGIALLWAGSKFKKASKIGLTIAFGLWFITSLLTQNSEQFFYSPQHEIAELLRSDRNDIFIEQASSSVKKKFCDDMQEITKSSPNKTYSIPEIAKKWGKSIALIKSMDKNNKIIGQGSGFAISRNGAIVTNYHVVESAYNVSIEFINGRFYQEAHLIAVSSEQDIALLIITAEAVEITPVILGDSDDLQVGERIVAIGNPYGWQNTVSDGLISGIREVNGCSLLQITAPISGGSSGGPLFNMNGEVVGITTIGSAWGAQNLNFAIPVNHLTSLITEVFINQL